MSNIIKLTARIKRETKLGFHLVNDSQLSGYGNELIRLAIQGLLYESLVTNGGDIKLSVTQHNPGSVLSNLSKVSVAVQETKSEQVEQIQSEHVGQTKTENIDEVEKEEQHDLVSYLGKYMDDSEHTFTDLNQNHE